MGGVRIRWRGVARAAAIVVVGLIVLRLLPELLRAPQPPPLGADVGLPQARPARVVAKREPKRPQRKPQPPRGPKRHPHERQARRKVQAVPDPPASNAVIGTRRRHRPDRRKPSPAAPVESTPSPVPEYVPPPTPEPLPTPLPEPAPTPPSAPGDGSEEFAPH
jgi:DNA polymerase III subunit gamma/tau